eukprot:scaffold262684_cov32-Tisochrysis_lutea.AAC.5
MRIGASALKKGNQPAWPRPDPSISRCDQKHRWKVNKNEPLPCLVSRMQLRAAICQNESPQGRLREHRRWHGALRQP